ncbi:dephospho-CoA kinase [Azospirillum sp. 412522]|nr:dephospho-CoA kinase [Azospirillum sp. 412522]MBY6261162.1 dephospho-CoA kinase [Azospirillum sp. 412522]
MIRPQLWVLAGPNGAGKSTIARRFVVGRIPFVDADDIARDVNPDDVNSLSAHMRAGRIALELREGYLNRNETFAMETTPTGKSELALMRRARDAGCKVNLIFVGVGNVAISAARVRTRILLGGHDVPKEAFSVAMGVAWRLWQTRLPSPTEPGSSTIPVHNGVC